VAWNSRLFIHLSASLPARPPIDGHAKVGHLWADGRPASIRGPGRRSMEDHVKCDPAWILHGPTDPRSPTGPPEMAAVPRADCHPDSPLPTGPVLGCRNPKHPANYVPQLARPPVPSSTGVRARHAGMTHRAQHILAGKPPVAPAARQMGPDAADDDVEGRGHRRAVWAVLRGVEGRGSIPSPPF
jgi:hypothetical protein